MAKSSILYDIAERCGGDVYIGVVGPVRTGKSTFIKKFMENAVIPKIENISEKERASDEMPQSASGRTVMTTEPKFVPENAVEINIGDNMNLKVKLIDCVGFVVSGAEGTMTENGPRMVHTPWSEEEIEFEKAAEIGTRKVINDHSTIGIVITTDGSFGEIPRENYLEAEEKCISELKQTGKPFVIVLNTINQENEETQNLAKHLSEKYSSPVLAKNCYDLKESDIYEIIGKIVLEFPVKEIAIRLPSWILSLNSDESVKAEFDSTLNELFANIHKAEEILGKANELSAKDMIEDAIISDSDLGKGLFKLKINIKEDLFYKVLTDKCGIPISSEEEIISIMSKYSDTKEKYDKLEAALIEADKFGYGIVIPSVDDLSLEEPEIVKKAGSYGVKIKAVAPSLHIIKAPINAEISPIVGTEKQSEDMVKYLLEEFKDDPKKLWDSNMFGKSLYELVNESLNSKLENMPIDAREKMGDTLKRIINEGSGGLICIIL